MGICQVFVDYALVGRATTFPLDLNGRNKPKLEIGSKFLAIGDAVPTRLAYVTELLGDDWVMVRLDEQLPSQIDCFYEPLN